MAEQHLSFAAMVAAVIEDEGFAALADQTLRIETTDPEAIPHEVDFVVCVNHVSSLPPELSVKVVYPRVRVGVFGRTLPGAVQKAGEIYKTLEGQTDLLQTHEEEDPNDPSQMISVTDGRIQAINGLTSPDPLVIPGPASQKMVMVSFEIQVCYAYA